MSYAELMGFKKNFGFYDGPQGMPCNLSIITLPEAMVTITLGTKTFTVQADNLGVARFEVGTAGLWNVVAVKDDITQVGTVKIENVVTTALNLPRSLEDFTWSEISAISRAGLAPYNFSIGDTKRIKVNNEFYDAQIIDFNHDEVATEYAVGYGREKAGITFQLKQVLTTAKRMNSSSATWETCEMRTTTLPQAKATMEQDLVDVIVPVMKYTFTTFGTTGTIKALVDDLFLLSRIEAVGTIGQHAGEGTQYLLYQQGDTNNSIKYDNSDTAHNWWTRSPFVSSSSTNQYYVVNTTGTVNSGVTYSSTSYISFAFCV